MKGLLGRKLGMTQVFTEDGVLIPVTVVEVTPNVVLQKKTIETDGYNAVQLGFEEIKEKRTTKANIGHCKKANTSPKRFIKEVRDCDMDVNVGDLVNVDIFAAGETVQVKVKVTMVQSFVTMLTKVQRLTVDLRTFVTSVH